MNIEQESVVGFHVGHGGADAADKPIVEIGYVRKAYKGVRVRAATANTIVIYVGREGVSTTTGYPLPAGEELCIPIEDPSKVYVVATPASNCQQTVGITGEIVGDTFTLTFRGATTAPIAVNANAAAVQTALQALSTIGTDNCTVIDTDGSEPYTVTFTGALAKQDVDLMTSVGVGVNEKQLIDVSDATSGDSILISYDGVAATSAVLVDNMPEAIQASMETIPALDGNVSVTGGPESGFTIEYIGDLALADIADDKITAICGSNEQQTITITAGELGDKLRITWGELDTGLLDYDLSGAALESALVAGGINDPDNVSVTGNGPYLVEFTGALARQDHAMLVGVCGKNEKQTITIDNGEAGDKLFLIYDGQSTVADLNYNDTKENVAAALKALSNIGDNDIVVTDGTPSGWVVEFIGDLARTDVPMISGVCGKNEKQTIGIDDGVTDGTFTLTFGEETTTAIAYNASATTVGNALKALNGIENNEVVVTGGPGPTADWVVEFTGSLGRSLISPMTGDGTLLVGDVKTVTVTETVAGHNAGVLVSETIAGHSATVDIQETHKGHDATIVVTETQKGDAACSVAIAKVADITVGSQYSWLAC